MALNAYAHMSVRNLPTTVLDDDELVAAIRDELPDASVVVTETCLELTLSQFAVTDGQVARHQLRRAARALRAVGLIDPEVVVEEIERPGVLDDIRCVRDMSLWHARRALAALTRRR